MFYVVQNYSNAFMTKNSLWRYELDCGHYEVRIKYVIDIWEYLDYTIFCNYF